MLHLQTHAAWIAILVATPACLTPPVLLEAGSDELPLDEFPSDAEPIEVRVGTGETLRGLFLPGDPGAPVVLHFLESTGSVTDGTEGISAHPVVWELRDIGLASLMADYRGIGPSDGERDARQIPAEARVLFEEATLRAGGDPGRVVLRGASIGTLAVASLLEDGVRPGAIVLAAPVLDETLVANEARNRYPAPIAWFASLLYRRPVGADLLDALEGAPSPVLAFLPWEDDFVRESELEHIAAAVEHGGGRVERHAGMDHIDTVLEAQIVSEAERELYAAVFPDLPDVAGRIERARAELGADSDLLDADPALAEDLEALLARARVEPANLALALVLTGAEPERAVDPAFRAWARQLEIEVLSLEALAALVDLSDPDGPLPLDEIGRYADETRSALAAAEGPVPELLLRRARSLELADSAWITHHGLGGRGFDRHVTFAEHVRRGQSNLPFGAPVRLRLPRPAAERRAFRILLKSAGVPDRVVEESDGPTRIEVLEHGGWRALDLDEPEGLGP